MLPLAMQIELVTYQDVVELSVNLYIFHRWGTQFI